MRQLVAVGIENRIEAKGLNGNLSKSAAKLKPQTHDLLLSPRREGAQHAAPLH